MTSYTLPESAHDDEDERRRRGLIWLWFSIIVVLLAGLIALITRLNGCRGETCGSSAQGATSAGGGSFNGGSNANSSSSAQSENSPGAGASSVSIRVSGSEQGGLAPGMTSPMVVSISNTGGQPARITSAGVAVGDASQSCTAANSIRVTHYDAATPGALSYDVAPGATVHIPLTISMLDLPTNQNACKNARFPLTFHATAKQG